MPEISILLLGNVDRSEFGPARQTLDALGLVTAVREVEEAAAVLAEGRVIPALIVVAQAFPGQFSHQAIDSLRRLAPLARVLALLGSWCEGELRTGHPWPAVVRIYWHQWVARFEAELARLLRGECPAFGLPVTATEEERMLLKPQTPCRGWQGLVAIYARTQPMQEWLSAACRSRGCTTVWLRPPRPARVEGAAAAIFDAPDLDRQELADFRRLRAAIGPAPVIALLDFPRIEDHRRVMDRGATAVLSKPLSLDALFWELQRAFEGGANHGCHAC